MIYNDVASQLQMLIKTSAPPLLEVSNLQLELPQLMPGQKVPAHVVANLPNGRFQVLIADKALDMNLPHNTQPGDIVDLVFVTSQPRLTFVLARDLGTVANTPQPNVSLSDTARFLGALLEKATQAPGQQTTTAPLTQISPLLAGAPANLADFAQALRGALTQSGLFYESHQAQWVVGERPLAELLREPQGRLSPGPEQSPAQTSATGTPSQAAALAEAKSSALPQQNDPQSLAKPGIINQPAHPDTLPLVRQQLEALDSRQVMWQGQVWPGQSMDWRIEERAAREQGGSEIEQTEWQTSLRLVLPQLGEISARLILHPQGLRIQLDASESTTAKLLQEQRPALQQGMETSGLQLAEIKVSHEAAG